MARRFATRLVLTGALLATAAPAGLAQCDPPSGPGTTVPPIAGVPLTPFSTTSDGPQAPVGPVTPSGLGGAGLLDELSELESLLSGSFDHGLEAGRLEGWELWWDLTHLALIDLRGVQDRTRRMTGSADFFLGQGESSSDGSVGDTRAEWVAGTLAPVLLDQLERGPAPALERELLLALGRAYALSTPADRLRVDAAFDRLLASSSLEVRRAALLARGLTGEPRHAPVLAAVALDEARGRQLVGSASVPEDLRATAAYGLGLLGAATEREDVRRFAVHALDRALRGTDGRREDLAVAALLAMASIPLERVGVRDPAGQPEPASGSRLALLRRLVEVLEQHPDARVRVHAPVALARVLDGLPEDADAVARLEVTRVLLSALESARTERAELPAAIAVALGHAVRPTDHELDRRAHDALVSLTEDARALTRHQALLALGRVAGAPGDDSRADEAVDVLLRVAERGDPAERAWACLAVGIAARERRLADLPVPDPWRAALVENLERARQPTVFSAAALACALAEATGARATALAGFDRLPDDATRTRTALALGLLGAHDAAAVLVDWRERRRTSFAAAYGATVGLELLGRADLARRPVGGSPSELPTTEAVALVRALGEVDGTSARAALLSFAVDESRSQVLRAVAVRALGRTAEARRVPPLAVLAGSAILAGAPATLFDGRGGGVLEMLD